jgi:hyperosmotically inducible protein
MDGIVRDFVSSLDWRLYGIPCGRRHDSSSVVTRGHLAHPALRYRRADGMTGTLSATSDKKEIYMRSFILKAVLAQLLLLSGLGALWAQQDTNSGQAPADNTKVNQADRSQTQPTADQQKENPTDRELARQIRRSLMQDKSLSTYAHNVKIIAQNGAVTLRGPVRSDEEKQAVEQKAAQIAGSDKVTSEIQVAPK